MIETKIKLSQLIDEFDFQSDFSSGYLDREAGEVLRISEDDRAAFEFSDEDSVPEWQKEYLEKIRPILEGTEDPDRYLALPDQFDFHEYRHMERFISRLSDELVRERLWSAIKGKGAFRRFKDGIHQYGLADRWYEYRDDAMKRFVIDWCEAEEIPYVDNTMN